MCVCDVCVCMSFHVCTYACVYIYIYIYIYIHIQPLRAFRRARISKLEFGTTDCKPRNCPQTVDMLQINADWTFSDAPISWNKSLEFLTFLEPEANSPYTIELLPRFFCFSKCVLSLVDWKSWFSLILSNTQYYQGVIPFFLSTTLGQLLAVQNICSILHLLRVHLEGKFSMNVIDVRKIANQQWGCEFRSESLCVVPNAFMALPNWAPNSDTWFFKMQVKLFLMQTRLGINASRDANWMPLRHTCWFSIGFITMFERPCWGYTGHM